MKSKRTEYLYNLAKEHGFKNYADYLNSLAKRKGLKSYNELLAKNQGFENVKEYKDNLAQQMGFKNQKEYKEYLARQKGFKNSSDMAKYIKHKNGECESMSENKSCSLFLGVHIAERVLSKIFENVTRMKNGNHGFDFICGKGFKIDVKSACIQKTVIKSIQYKQWAFTLKRNKIADYFLLLAFDNREDLNPKHIWLIKGDEKIGRGGKYLFELINFGISNTDKGIKKMQKYEINDKLKEVISCCNHLKGI